MLQFHDRGVPMLVIGSLMFVPGVYHVRIAYYASRGVKGYRYEDIPRFDD
jgi:hypothetical protein